MRKLFVLLKLNFRALLSSFSFGRGKKRKMGMLGATLFLGGMAVYLSVIYSMLVAEAMSEAGLLDSMLPLMAVMACVMALMMTVFAASGFIFGGKDSDLMLSLPVSAFLVMLSKLLALYVENFIFVALWMLPTGIIYLMHGGALTAGFIVGLMLTMAFLPFIPYLFGMIVGFIIAWFTSHMKKNVILSNLLYFVFFAVLIIGSSQMANIGNLIVNNTAQFNTLLKTWLLPFGLMQNMLIGNIIYAVPFVLICVLPFVLFTYLFSINYKRLLTVLASHKTRSDYKLGRYGAQGQLKALVKKEFGRFFGSTIYVFNCSFGGFMLIIGAVASIVMRGRIMPVIEMMGGVSSVTPIFAAAVIFMTATVNTTCVSISLEGKTLWILKEAPVTPFALFGAKAAVNMVMALSCAYLSTLIIGIMYGVAPLAILSIMLACTAASAGVAVSGLWINLLLPKMDGINDTVIVKQSASAMVSMLSGMAIAAIACVLMFVFHLPVTVFCAVFALILLAIAFILWQLLLKRGYRILMNI